jgi:hypothetical protein
VRRFERKLAAPVRGRLLRPTRQSEAVRKLRNYRTVVTIVEQAVTELLAGRPVVSVEYPRFKAVARETLGLLWRRPKMQPASGNMKGETQIAGRALDGELALRAEYWKTQKLDAGLVCEVQDMVVRRLAELREAHPELFPDAGQ